MAGGRGGEVNQFGPDFYAGAPGGGPASGLSPNGEDGRGQITFGGAGGGGGGAGGGLGGDGGTGVNGNVGVPGTGGSTPGADGNPGTLSAGGGGGAGGAHGFTGAVLPNTTLVGGNAGNGGDSGSRGGGGGGEGGYGAVLTANTYNHNLTITGGTGGTGGNTTAPPSYAGAGGDGGIGVYFANPASLENSGTIVGGNGGDSIRQAGLGGAGIVGSNLRIVNTGTISGGFTGNNSSVQADAITFVSGVNFLNVGGQILGNLAIKTGTLQLDVTGFETLGNNITGSGSIIKSGNGALTLEGANSYSGTTTIQSGVLAVREASGLGNGSATNDLVFSGGELRLIGSFTLNSARDVLLDAGGGRIDTNGNNLAVAGTISGVGSLTKSGGGFLSLNSTNTFTGGTTLQAGDLRLGANNAAGTGDMTIASGRLDLNGFSQTVSSLSVSSAGSITNGTATPGKGSILTVNGGGRVDGSIVDGTTNNISVIKESAGTLVLSGNNSFSGEVAINAGTLIAESAQALGSAVSGTKVAAGATLQLVGGISIGNESLSLAGAGAGGSGALLNSSGVNTFGGPIALTADALIQTAAGSVMNITGAVTGDGGSRTLTLGGAGFGNLSGAVAASVGRINKEGTGNWIISGNNNSGDINVSSGALDLRNGSAVADFASVTVANATGALVFVRNSEVIGSLSGGGAVGGEVEVLSSQFLTTGANNSTATFSGLISGLGGLVKTGTGNWTLAGANNYSGGTTVSSGKLLVGNNTGSATGLGNVTVASGASLGGSGAITGAVSVAGGATLAPGNSPGLLATGSLTFTTGAIFQIELGGTIVGSGYDQVSVTGTVNLGGATLNASAFASFVPAAGQSFTIISNDGTDLVVGTFAGLAEGSTVAVGGVAMRISYVGGDGNDVTLAVVVPPPTPTPTPTPNVTPVSTTPSDGADLLTGTSGADAINGGGGNDTINGGTGNDTLLGGVGSDQITATPSAGETVLIYGGTGFADPNDGGDTISISGAGGGDVFGNGGDDIIDFTALGRGSIFGGVGNDRITIINDAANTVTGGPGADIVQIAGNGNNLIVGGSSITDPNDVADRITINGNGNNLVYANGGDDVIVITGSGRNTVFGGVGNDTMTGGSGDDRLVGGPGANVYTGGGGADRFVHAVGGMDIVTDFNFAQGDRLEVGGQAYTVTTASDGSAALVFGDGGVIILQGVTQSQFSAGYVAG